MENEKTMTLAERDEYNLFNDASLKALYDKLPEEERATYKKQGEYMYSRDYDKIDNDLQARMIESSAYISEGMKSGLRPSQLEENEREVMRSIYGKKWYEKYYFTSESD